jgi:polyhydroxyalkanoate synthesis regulator phasin
LAQRAESIGRLARRRSDGVLDDLRNYLQLASGLTEATASKAKDAVTGLLAHGVTLSSKAIPAPEMMGQVQELADDLMATSRNNREMLVGMIRAEVDRNVGRMGFVREDELAALRRHVQRLEKQLADVQESLAATPPAPPAQTYPAQTYPARAESAAVDQAPDVETPAVVDVDTADAIASAAEDASPAVPSPEAPKKKKKIIVDPGA